MASKIEAATGLDWVEALCQTREFSEYMLYGYFVQNDAEVFRQAHPHLAHAMHQLLGFNQSSARMN